MSAQRGMPPMAAMSERFTAIAFQPMSAGVAQARRKCTSSITRSVVARSEEPGVTESTAASSPMPTGTPAAGAPPPPSRMQRISSSSPSSRTLTGSPAEGEKEGDDLEAPDRPSPLGDGNHAQEIAEQGLALGGEDGLGVELHALHGVAAMAQPHDLPVLGAGGDLEIGGEALPQHHQRVIASGLESRREAGEDAAPVVLDARGLPVHLHRRPRHRAPEGLADGLMAQ